MSQDDALKINPEDLEQWLENDSKPKNKPEKKKRDSISLPGDEIEIKIEEYNKSGSNSLGKSRSKGLAESSLIPNISKVAFDHSSGKIDLHIEYHQISDPSPPTVQQVNRLLLEAFKSLF